MREKMLGLLSISRRDSFVLLKRWDANSHTALPKLKMKRFQMIILKMKIIWKTTQQPWRKMTKTNLTIEMTSECQGCGQFPDEFECVLFSDRFFSECVKKDHMKNLHYCLNCGDDVVWLEWSTKRTVSCTLFLRVFMLGMEFWWRIFRRGCAGDIMGLF